MDGWLTMARSRTALKAEALERARAARRGLDAERETRDRAVEDAAAGYFTADERRAGLLDQIATIETEMAAAIAALRALKEPTGRIAILLGIDAREVRRLAAAVLNTGPDTTGADDAAVSATASDKTHDVDKEHDDTTTSEAPGDLVGATVRSS
jgi:hypothetical protein